MSCIYLDHTGKEIEKDDRIHYATKGTIYIGRVVSLLPNNEGIKVIGVKKKREALLKRTTDKVIIVHKGYYKEHKRAQRTGKT